VVDRLRAGYGAIEIVRGASLEAGSGELVVLVGPNGAGKSTLVRAVFGLVSTTGGHVRLGGEDLTNVPTTGRVRRGLGFVPQTHNTFATLTVEENLEMGAFLRPSALRAGLERVYDLFPALADRRRQTAGTMSGGEQQMVALGRALMLEPTVLLLDEPSAGLAPRAVAQILERIRTIARLGTAVVMVEQNARAALAIADRGYVLVTGEVRHHGPARALLDDPVLGDLYLGRGRREAAGSTHQGEHG
jgi:branched-chain amino acid transport system ATP-binding protein